MHSLYMMQLWNQTKDKFHYILLILTIKYCYLYNTYIIVPNLDYGEK